MMRRIARVISTALVAVLAVAGAPTRADAADGARPFKFDATVSSVGTPVPGRTFEVTDITGATPGTPVADSVTVHVYSALRPFGADATRYLQTQPS